MIKQLVLKFVLFYKKALSPGLVVLFGAGCRFTPTCSDYAADAIKIYGLVKGGKLALRRLLRCNPFSRARYDPV